MKICFDQEIDKTRQKIDRKPNLRLKPIPNTQIMQNHFFVCIDFLSFEKSRPNLPGNGRHILLVLKILLLSLAKRYCLW